MPPQLKHPGFSTCLRLHRIIMGAKFTWAEGKRTWLDVQHHLHRLLPEGYHGVQARQIKIIFDKVLRHFAEVLVTG